MRHHYIHIIELFHMVLLSKVANKNLTKEEKLSRDILSFVLSFYPNFLPQTCTTKE